MVRTFDPYSNKQQMILVTGATGKYGRNVIDHLLTKGVDAAQIAVLVRDAAKGQTLKDKGVELRIGDYTEYDSLVRAFRGVDKLLLVSSSDREITNRTAQHINAIKAAKEADVKHIVYTSFIRKPEFENSAIALFEESHLETEQFIKNSGIDYTILQNGIYLEMIPVFAGEKAAETGVITLPAQEGKASWVLREELAEAAAHVLTTQGHEDKTYALTNTESTSFGDVASELSGLLGKAIHYQSPPVDEFQATMKQFGVPEVYIGMFTMWAGALAEGMLDVNDATLGSFLGRKPTTTKQFIAQVYG